MDGCATPVYHYDKGAESPALEAVQYYINHMYTDLLGLFSALYGSDYEQVEDNAVEWTLESGDMLALYWWDAPYDVAYILYATASFANGE